MAYRTQYIENRDYSAEEVVDVVNNHNFYGNWGVLGASFFSSLLIYRHIAPAIIVSAVQYNDSQSTIDLKDVTDSQYSGIEITNFLNEFAQVSMVRPGYTAKKKELIQKLLNHEYNSKDVFTEDQMTPFSWPGAVLQATKEEVEKQFAALEQNKVLAIDPIQQEAVEESYHNCIHDSLVNNQLETQTDSI